MSSDEVNHIEYSEEKEENSGDNEQSYDEEADAKPDDLSSPTNVNSEIKYDDEIDENEPTSPSHEHEVNIEVEELPQSGTTQSFETKVDSAPNDGEKRTERRRDRRRRRKLTEENEGLTKDNAQSNVSKFEREEVNDKYSQKTDISQDSMASSETVLSPTSNFNVSSEDDDKKADKEEKEKDDKDVVEVGTAASRRKALEDYAEEATKSQIASSHALEDEGIVLRPGSAASTKAKLERMSSEEKVIEKEVDVDTPKLGTAAAKRAKFEEKAKLSMGEENLSSSFDDGLKQRTQRRSKWPEPKTNYRERRGMKKGMSLDEGASTMVEKENAKNIEKSKEAQTEENGKEETPAQSRNRQSPSDEEPKSPVRTAAIRNKLVRMLSQEDTLKPALDRIGSARPTSGSARNLRARFEAGQVKQEESHFTGKKPSISSRSGYASKVRERFESGEVSRRRTPSTADEEDTAPPGDTASRRSRRLSSTRSSEGEGVTMSRSAKELRSRFENPSHTTTNQVKRNFVLRPKAAGLPLSSKFNKAGPVVNKCTKCSKRVYPMEMITADDKPFHRFCFKCTECKATLRLGNYAALQGQIYCKPHFKQLFKVKGNYDEGFGRQQHKKNWDEKAKTEENGDEYKVSGNDDNESDANRNLKSPTALDNDDVEHDLTNGYEDDNDDNDDRVSAAQANGHVILNHKDSFDEVEA